MTTASDGPERAVTLVIATRNRRDELLRTLSVVEGSAPGTPTVVVDNGSTDGTCEGVRTCHPWVDVVALGSNAGGAARNVGAARAGTRYVAFCDDDSWWARGALERAAELLDADPRLAVVAGRILVGADERTDPTSTLMAESPLPRRAGLTGPAVLGFVACGTVVRRDAFLGVGGFPRRYGIGGEEAPVALALAAAGWDLVYAEEVVAHHHPSASRAPDERRRVVLRNAIWTAWLRLPATMAARETLRLAREAPPPVRRAGVLAAVAGVPWLARERAAVPAELARAFVSLSR